MSKGLRRPPCWLEARLDFAGPSSVGIVAAETAASRQPDLSEQRPAPGSPCFVAILEDLALLLKKERLPNLMRPDSSNTELVPRQGPSSRHYLGLVVCS